MNLSALILADKKELINQVIKKVMGEKHLNNPKLIKAGFKGIIRADYLYRKNKRTSKFTLYAKYIIREELVAAYVGIDRKKGEKYAKLMGYTDAAKGKVEALLV